MNTRGLMELIVLNIGLDAGILDAHLYGLFVVMAIVTTLMAGPILAALYPGQAEPAPFVLGKRRRAGWRGRARAAVDRA
jgi:Kef-type K+ transport system membrane component KefB